MRRQRKMVIFLLLALAVAFMPVGPTSVPATAQDEGEGLLVGRISHVDGQLLRYVAADRDWVAAIRDAPFGFDDTLYSGTEGRAEFILPNDTWIRIGWSTQIQLISLKDDLTAIDLASGTARCYNRSSDAVIKATTPFGYVIGEPDTSFDLYVGDESIEVIAIRGQVYFVRDSDQARFDLAAGSASIIADGQGVYAGEGNIDAEWDDWNGGRDSAWTRRLQARGPSARYVNEDLVDEAYALDESGRWEEIVYEGRPQHFWRPTTVPVGWAPFTNGRWAVYRDDQTWIPDEPFGYVTHHYGNWIYINNVWFWSPPPPRAVLGIGVAPGVHVGVSLGTRAPGRPIWYPGRVAWLHSADTVGWVPLAPSEPYYTNHSWGPGTTVIAGAGAVAIALTSYRYLDRAVVVPQDNFYRVRSYNNVRITNITNTTIINNYRPAPVVNNTVIKNYNNIRERYNYTNVPVERKPHQEVVRRIERNQKVAQETARVDGKAIRTSVERARPVAAVSPPAKVAPPRVSTKLVRPEEVTKPKAEVQFQKKEIKTKTKPVTESSATKMTFPEPKKGKPAREVRPGEPVKVVPPAAVPEKAGPPRAPQETRPGEPVRPVPPAKEVKPGEPAKVVPPAAPPEKVVPSKPGQEMKPLQPGKPGEPVRPAPRVPEEKPAKEMKPVTPPPPPAGREMRPPEPTAPRRPAPEMREQPKPPAEVPQKGGPARPPQEMKPAVPPTPPAGKEVRPTGPPPQPPAREMKPGEPPATPKRPGPEMREQPKPHRGPEQPDAPGQQKDDKEKKKRPGQEGLQTN